MLWQLFDKSTPANFQQMDLIVERSRLLYGDGDLDLLVAKIKVHFTDSEWNIFISMSEKVFLGLLESAESCFDRDKVQKILLHIASYPSKKSTGFWFGGNTKVSCDNQRIVDKAASALLIGASLVADDHAVITSCLELIEMSYTCMGEFVHKVGTQDDRLLGCLLALIKLKVHTQDNGFFNYRHGIIHSFASVHFSYELIIDWLNSELICHIFLLNFVEDLTSNIDVWKKCAEEVQIQREIPCKMSYMPGEWIEISAEKKTGLILQLTELAGTRAINKNVVISNEEPKRLFVPFKVNISQESYFQLLYDMLVRLRLRLEAISSKKELGNYKSIINLVQKFENRIDNSDATVCSIEETNERPPVKRSKLGINSI